MSSIYQDLLDQKKQLAVIGLGYVGLPIALAFARKIKVIGFDISPERVDMMRRGEDPSNELESSAFEGCDIHFTADPKELEAASFYVVAVPTPVDVHRVPDLKALKAASRTVSQVIAPGDYVVYESTVYPGCTEEECLPILEELSQLSLGADFKLGYSPERINPGDMKHRLENTVKVVSGSDEEALEEIRKVYELVVTEASVYPAASIKVAEAAKVIENTQRDLNIALMNELSKIFHKIGINTYDVIDAAATKWNFVPFQPGLVGGHCIGVDPYYLTYKSVQLGYAPEVILSGRNINDGMAGYVAQTLVQLLISQGKPVASSRALVLGTTFKENVSDIRNSKVADLIRALHRFSIEVDVLDPHASSDELDHEYGYRLSEEQGNDYDSIILAVPHEQYLNLPESHFRDISGDNSIFIDIKGVYKNKIHHMTYWSL
jgi:UDP-N-acetyl-D-galactosamine dehydrogenase